MNDAMDLKQLELEIQKLDEALQAERRAAQHTHRTFLGVSAFLVALVAGFFFLNYSWFRSELTAEKFAPRIERELQEVSPTALREVSRLGQDLIPVYAAEWKKQIQTAWPEIVQRIDDEVGKLGDNIATRVKDLLAESQRRVLDSTEKTILEQYPELKDPQKLEELDRRLHSVCDRTLERTLLDFDKLFAKDISRLQEAVFKFDVSDTDETTVDLQKKFLHLWLQILDQEIMEL